MSDSTSLLDSITPGQSSKETAVMALFDAGSANVLFGRRAPTTAALTWGYYGGKFQKADLSIASIANGTIALTASTTNYLYATSAGVVTKVTSAPAGWPGPLASDAVALYEIVTGAASVTSYTDWRAPMRGPTGAAGAAGAAGATGATGATGAAGSISDGDKGDITVSSSGATWTVDNDAITYAKMQNVSATSRVLGRKTAGAGDTEEVTLSELLDFIGSAAQGDILYRGSSSWARLAAGTSGQVLKTLGAGANPAWDSPAFDVQAFYPGVPAASAKVLRIPVARAVAFPANFSGSYAKAGTAATASTAFDVQNNGSTIGTITFASSGTTATFTTVSGTSKTLAAGDVLSIIAPGSADATIADIGFVLAGTR